MAKLSEITDLWLKESLGVINEETLRQYAWLMEQFVYSRFGDNLSVSEDEALDLFNALVDSGKSESTAYMCVRVLRRVLEYGASIGVCEEPGWDLDISTPGRKREAIILSPDEESHLSRVLIEKPDNRNLGLFMVLSAGLRPCEVLAMRWKDISFAKKEMRAHSERGAVNQRSRTVRTIPLGERQMLYLRKLKGQADDYICSGTPKPLARALFDQTLRRLIRRELLPPASLMDLRHTYAVRCIEAGMGYDMLASRLGLDVTHHFRKFYSGLVSDDQRERLDRERMEGRKVRVAPEHIAGGPVDPEATPYRMKLEKRRQELKDELESLEGELAIIRNLHYSDCIQGVHRKAFYDFVERVLPDDKDAQFAVDYLRANMRVEEMSLRKVTTPQAIRRRVTHGFRELSSRIRELEAIEGWEMLPLFNELCSRIEAALGKNEEYLP